MGLKHSALAMDGEISDNSNRGKGEKKEERVDRTSYSFKLSNRRLQVRFNRSVRHRPPRLCLLRADSLTTHAARARTRPRRLVRPKALGESGTEIHRENSYLCASCPLGQAIFMCVVGDDGIRPAAIQGKHTGACGRSHSRW